MLLVKNKYIFKKPLLCKLEIPKWLYGDKNQDIVVKHTLAIHMMDNYEAVKKSWFEKNI